MKKIIKILLVCLVTFGLTACSQENQDTTKTIKWNKENKLDNLISYQIESIGKPKQIIPDTINIVSPQAIMVTTEICFNMLIKFWGFKKL